MRQLISSSIALLLTASLSVFAAGQGTTSADSSKPEAKTESKAGGGSQTGNRAKNRPLLAITPEREAAAMTFVERNHTELAGLLGSLKTNQPKQYEQAIREIYRVTERLAGIQERDPLHYELEVKLWTAQSQVQLLAARLKMGDNEEHRKQLREALSAQIAARLEVLKHQREQASQRLTKMDKEIGQIEAGREQVIEKQLDVLTRMNAKSNPKTAGAKSAVKRAGKVSERKAAE